MSHKNYWLEWIILFSLISLPQAHGQSRQSADSMPDVCRDIQVIVQDCYGLFIEGAVVATETVEAVTDSRGKVFISCRSYKETSTLTEVRALGYRTARLVLDFKADCRFEVTLERENAALLPAEKIVSLRELSPGIKAKSLALQKQARDAFVREDYDRTEKLLLDALNLTPSSSSILTNLGVAAARRKNMDSAEMWYQKAIEANPNQAEAISNLALIRWAQHRSEESYQLLTKAASLKYETKPGNYIIGAICLRKGLYKEAIDRLKKVTADQFPLRDLYLSLALYNDRRIKDATRVYRHFIERRRAPYVVSTLLHKAES
jgi:tetratricopeptide (TPR) repeat protein